MKNISDYLDLIKEKHHIEHEKDLAKLIEIKPSSLSAIRSGNGTREKTACRIAELAGVNADKVLLAATEARCKDPELKKLWHTIAKKYESVAASILAITALSPVFDGIKCILCKIVNVKNSTKLKAV